VSIESVNRIDLSITSIDKIERVNLLHKVSVTNKWQPPFWTWKRTSSGWATVESKILVQYCPDYGSNTEDNETEEDI